MNSVYRSVTTSNGVINQNHSIRFCDPVHNSSVRRKLDPELIEFLNTLHWEEEVPSNSGDDAFTAITPVNVSVDHDNVDSIIDMAVPTEIDVIVPVSPANETRLPTNVHPNVIEFSTDSIDPITREVGLDVEPFDINAKDSVSSCEDSISMMDLEPSHNLVDETECGHVLEVLLENSHDCFRPPMPLVSCVELVRTSQAPRPTKNSIAEPVTSMDAGTTPVPGKIDADLSQDPSETKLALEAILLPNAADPEAMLLRLKQVMKKSAETQSALQDWDKKRGLPKSHSPTMVNSSRSRKQLQQGIVLRKWNASPLITVPGEASLTNPNKRSRIHQSQ